MLDKVKRDYIQAKKNINEKYWKELENVGVVLDKKSPKYVGGIIDQIEKAKNNRNLLDAKRKEVGGIQSDLLNRGIDVDADYELKNIDAIKEQITTLKVKIERLSEVPSGD